MVGLFILNRNLHGGQNPYANFPVAGKLKM
jgi:hypothetical protein